MAEEKKSGMERRMVHRLIAHWRAAHVEDHLPTLAAVLVRNLEDIAACMFVLRIHDDESDPVFEFVGDSFFGKDSVKLTGVTVSRVPPKTLLGQTAKNYRKVLDKSVPFSLGGDFQNNEGVTVLYRSVILPVRDTEGYVSHLVGAANCKKKV